MLAVGCVAVFLRTLKQRDPECAPPNPPIDWKERRAYRGYFLQIMLHFSQKYAVFAGPSGVPLLTLLEETLHRFATRVLEVAVRVHNMPIDEDVAQEKDLRHLEPRHVLTSLERDLDAFWPGRQWTEGRDALRMPTEEEANIPARFIDLEELEVLDLRGASGPAVDWAQFGISGKQGGKKRD